MVVFREFLISYYYIVNHFLNFIIIMKGFCLQWKIQKIYTVIDCRYISGAITPLAQWLTEDLHPLPKCLWKKYQNFFDAYSLIIILKNNSFQKFENEWFLTNCTRVIFRSTELFLAFWWRILVSELVRLKCYRI